MKFSVTDVNSKDLQVTLRTFWCNFSIVMESKKKKKDERPVFDSIRKPIAPPSRKFGKPKPEEKANPARRKTKHKREENLQD